MTKFDPDRSWTMQDDKTVRGCNFTCFHAGPKERWTEFRLNPPDVPLPARGKLFLRRLLGSAGLEMSLNVVPPGKGIPFLHLAEGESFTTVELKINFLRAVRQGRLIAEAKVVKAGSALGYVECDVSDQDGRLVARASSTCMKLRQDRPPTA